MSRSSNLLIYFISLIFLSFLPYYTEQEYTIDTELGFSTGPEIGQSVPLFSLPDQNGRQVNLKNLIGENGAILNFFRSASW